LAELRQGGGKKRHGKKSAKEVEKRRGRSVRKNVENKKRKKTSPVETMGGTKETNPEGRGKKKNSRRETE